MVWFCILRAGRARLIALDLSVLIVSFLDVVWQFMSVVNCIFFSETRSFPVLVVDSTDDSLETEKKSLFQAEFFRNSRQESTSPSFSTQSILRAKRELNSDENTVISLSVAVICIRVQNLQLPAVIFPTYSNLYDTIQASSNDALKLRVDVLHCFWKVMFENVNMNNIKES